VWAVSKDTAIDIVCNTEYSYPSFSNKVLGRVRGAPRSSRSR
jgi:hypothetical protein